MLIGSVAENIVRQRTALFSSYPLFESSLGVEDHERKGGQDLRRKWQLAVSPFTRAYPSWIKRSPI